MALRLRYRPDDPALPSRSGARRARAGGAKQEPARPGPDGRVAVARLWPTGSPWPPPLVDGAGEPLIGFPFYDRANAEPAAPTPGRSRGRGAGAPFRDALLGLVGRPPAAARRRAASVSPNATAREGGRDASRQSTARSSTSTAARPREGVGRAADTLTRTASSCFPASPTPVEPDLDDPGSWAGRVEMLSACDALLLVVAASAARWTPIWCRRTARQEFGARRSRTTSCHARCSTALARRSARQAARRRRAPQRRVDRCDPAAWPPTSGSGSSAWPGRSGRPMSLPGFDAAEATFDVVLPPGRIQGCDRSSKDEWPIFFGRERMVDEAIARLLAALVVVHGDSGCGKSSLIRAGVLPPRAGGARGGLAGGPARGARRSAAAEARARWPRPTGRAG